MTGLVRVMAMGHFAGRADAIGIAGSYASEATPFSNGHAR
jgi:hypothetical protein